MSVRKAVRTGRAGDVIYVDKASPYVGAFSSLSVHLQPKKRQGTEARKVIVWLGGIPIGSWVVNCKEEGDGPASV